MAAGHSIAGMTVLFIALAVLTIAEPMAAVVAAALVLSYRIRKQGARRKQVAVARFVADEQYRLWGIKEE